MKYRNNEPKNTKQAGRFMLLLTAIIFILSCSKYATLPEIQQEDPISIAKQQFQKDSIAFERSGQKPNYNFRQSLKRIIHWNAAEQKDEKTFVPVHLLLPQGTVAPDGKRTLSQQSWLIIENPNDNNLQNNYYLMTLFEDQVDTVESGFSGNIIFEDYFGGGTKFSRFENGKQMKKEVRQGAANSNDTKSKAVVYDCETVVVAAVCVGDPTDDSAPMICSNRYETVCGFTSIDDGMFPPNTGGNSGSVGGGDSSSDNNNTWPKNLTLFQNKGEIIKEIKKYLECFDSEKPLIITVYADQPTPGKRSTWSGFPTNPDVGHTFIAINQGHVTRVLGFYPKDGVNPITSPSDKSVLINDSGHQYDVSFTYIVPSTHSSSVINSIVNHRSIYNLNSYNCTNFGIEISKMAGVNLPTSIGSWPGGGGANPGGLGEDIRQLKNSNITKNTSGGKALSNTGNCNK